MLALERWVSLAVAFNVWVGRSLLPHSSSVLHFAALRAAARAHRAGTALRTAQHARARFALRDAFCAFAHARRARRAPACRLRRALYRACRSVHWCWFFSPVAKKVHASYIAKKEKKKKKLHTHPPAHLPHFFSLSGLWFILPHLSPLYPIVPYLWARQPFVVEILMACLNENEPRLPRLPLPLYYRQLLRTLFVIPHAHLGYSLPRGPSITRVCPTWHVHCF